VLARNIVSAALLGAFVACSSGIPGGGDPPDGGSRSRPRFEDYIRGDRFPKLVLEIDSVPGFEPRSSSEDAVVQGLADLLSRPGAISASGSTSPSYSMGADHAWTFPELDALATSTFDLSAGPDAIKMHVLFVDGHSAEDNQNGKILGLAWAHTHLVVFKKTIEDACGTGLTGLLAEQVCADAELGVWMHEIGHLLGLVDNGLPMVTPHKDSLHGAHDQSDACIMFWAYETGSVLDEIRARVTGGNASKLDFDDACKNDIAAVRNL
jgi:hypothetical protein